VLVAIGAEMRGEAAIAQRIGGEPRQRHVVELDALEAAAEAQRIAIVEGELEIGLRDARPPLVETFEQRCRVVGLASHDLHPGVARRVDEAARA